MARTAFPVASSNRARRSKALGVIRLAPACIGGRDQFGRSPALDRRGVATESTPDGHHRVVFDFT